MLLTCRFLVDVADVNRWRPAGQAQMHEGDAPLLYLQLIDAAAFTQSEGFNPPGRRYVPVPGSALQVTLLSIDSAKQAVKSAYQPFVYDPSIWAIQMLSTDKIAGTVNLQLALTEGAVTTRGSVPAALLIRPLAV